MMVTSDDNGCRMNMIYCLSWLLSPGNGGTTGTTVGTQQGFRDAFILAVRETWQPDYGQI